MVLHAKILVRITEATLSFVSIIYYISIRNSHDSFTFGETLKRVTRLKERLKYWRLHISVWMDREAHLFDRKTGLKTKLADQPEIHLNGHVLESDTRRIVQHDQSQYVGHAKHWLSPLANDKHVHTDHILLDSKETAILITRPKQEPDKQ